MTYRLFFTRKAEKDLIALDKKIQKILADKLRFFMASKDPLRYAKKLKNARLGTFRFRIGEYRIIFDVDKKGNINVLYILRIKHRKNIYK